MHTAELVAHGIRGDVLPALLIVATRLPHGVLPRSLVRLLHTADAEVETWAHLLDLDPGQTLAAALGADQVGPEADGGLGVPPARLLLGGHGDDVLQALDVDLVQRLAPEEVEEEALGERVLVGDGALERRAGEQQHGPQPDGELLGPELRDGAEALGVKVQLQHVEDLGRKGADKGQRVRALLARAAKDEQAGVVLLREELERRRVLEGVDGVLLCELLGERLAHGVQLRQGVLHYLRAGGAAEEEARLGVLNGLGLALLERPLGPGIARLAADNPVSVSGLGIGRSGGEGNLGGGGSRCIDSHLTKHGE